MLWVAQIVRVYRRMAGWLANGKVRAMERAWHNSGNIPAFAWRGREKTKSSVRIADFQLAILPRHFMNTKCNRIHPVCWTAVARMRWMTLLAVPLCAQADLLNGAWEWRGRIRKCKYSKPSLIRLQLIRMSDNPDRNMKSEKCCSQLSTYYESHKAFKKADESLVCSDKTWTIPSNLHYYVQKQV
jgi:hypothetical protein